ncbi:hypothetical protein ACH4ND_03695 [Streptomyces sp. NPDC017179]|uniref:hypothetical protein n=1 Tax=Streptomyces sp. NPDC017179 TaxID=3364979 RepID=UPI0037BCF81A
MSAATDSARIAPPGNVLTQSVRDSMVVAKRNLIRMTRIPDPVRSYRSGFISPRIRDLDVNGLEFGGRGLRHPAFDGGGARSNTWKEQAK